MSTEFKRAWDYPKAHDQPSTTERSESALNGLLCELQEKDNARI